MNNKFDINLNSIELKAKKLYEIVKSLRSPDGCPWDRNLKIENCTEYLLEETYEAIESIEKNDMNGLKEELGDILSQVFMISQIADENKFFNINDVFEGISKKLVFRHPHVFADEKAENPNEVLKIWNRQKLKEKKERKNIIEGIPKALPPSYTLIKLFRKLNHYPKQYKDIIEKIISNSNSIKEFFPEFIKMVNESIEKGFSINENEKNIEFLANTFVLLYFYTFLLGIDSEKILREKIDEIYQFFEKSEN